MYISMVYKVVGDIRSAAGGRAEGGGLGEAGYQRGKYTRLLRMTEMHCRTGKRAGERFSSTAAAVRFN